MTKKDSNKIKNYSNAHPKLKMQTKPYGIEDRKIKIEKLLSREDSEILKKTKGLGLYPSSKEKKVSGLGLYPSPKVKVKKVTNGTDKN
jgi:hypothetical protein